MFVKHKVKAFHAILTFFRLALWSDKIILFLFVIFESSSDRNLLEIESVVPQHHSVVKHLQARETSLLLFRFWCWFCVFVVAFEPKEGKHVGARCGGGTSRTANVRDGMY